MNKRCFILLIVSLLLLCCSVPAFAAGPPTADGVYEVPIRLWHSEKDQASTGDSYLVQTARLEVKGGKTTITLAAENGIKNFWYYVDGSVEGGTAEAQRVSDVTIAGVAHATGYQFTLPTSNTYVGVKFKLSVIPMSPSARIKLDYGNVAVLSQAQVKTTAAAVTTTTSAPTESIASESSTEAPSASTEDAASAEDASESGLTTSAQPTPAESTTTVELTTEAETASASGALRYVMIALLVLLVLGAVVWMVMKKRR